MQQLAYQMKAREPLPRHKMPRIDLTHVKIVDEC